MFTLRWPFHWPMLGLVRPNESNENNENVSEWNECERVQRCEREVTRGNGRSVRVYLGFMLPFCSRCW